jgi:DNA-binding CsgD family transcriptional regulator/predicted Ser/Thr protein kinase
LTLDVHDAAISRQMSCPTEDTLLAVAEGRFAGDTDRTYGHIESCATCRMVFNDLARSYGREGDLPHVGRPVGRYQLLRLVGIGGMGMVYAARDPQLDREVAIKLLRADIDPQADNLRERLQREAQAMARLSHPNVIAVYDVGLHCEHVFIAMELVQGRTLRQWLDEPRSWRDVLRVLTSAGRGLAAAHAVGIVHRDFKPDNVMIGRDGSVRVLDFGLARAVADEPRSFGEAASGALASSLSGSAGLLGTPAFMAPEQFLGLPALPQTDQFSFCVVLYRALYGEAPFPGESIESIAESVIKGRVRSPAKSSRVPTRVRDTILRGLATDPAQRWPSMEALLDALSSDTAQAPRRSSGGDATRVEGADVLSLIDAAYATDADEGTWLRGLATAARAVLDTGLGLFTVCYDAADPGQFRIRESIIEGLPDGVGPVLARHTALFDRAWVEATFLGFVCDHIRHPRFARHPAATPTLLDELYARHGIQDIFSINAIDPTGLGHQINVFQPRRCRITPAARAHWSRVAAHIAAGNRLRARLGRAPKAPPEAVLDAHGRIVHAEGEARTPDARERLTASVRARERVRGKLRRSDPDRAVAEWKGLVAARWTLVDQFERDGRRYLVARQNDPEIAGVEALTARERCAVGFAALAHTNELIAYEMGIAPSTVSQLLQRAARRMGAGSRAELVRKFLEHNTGRAAK